MLPEEVYKRMQEIVGEDYVSQEPAILDSYAYQPFHKTDPGSWIHRPAAVVLPGSTEEVQAVLRLCHQHRIRSKAHSTGFGAHSGPGSEGVLQIDLRRMDRILEIDERNMYAVVEPYVTCAQLQAELMKRGLNLHIIGAGSHTSPLASCTSHIGMGWSGISMGFNGRNLMGVEWVLPDGELLSMGTTGSDLGWFNGDGPGPSLRGVMRGWAGADGGMGVFTRISFKLYHWPGPPQPEVEDMLPATQVQVPENFKIYNCIFPSYEAWGEAAYKMGDAEIGYIANKNAVGLSMWVMSPRFMRRVVDLPYLKRAINSSQHCMQVVLAGYYPGDLDYQRKVLERIVDECDGVLLDLSLLPWLEGGFWWGMIRSSMPPMIFRAGSNFFTSLGGDESVDNTVLQARIGEKIKEKFIEKEYLMDDLTDNSWGGPYEYGMYCHQEEICLFDSRNPRHFDHLEEYAEACAEATIEHHLGGVGFALFMGNPAHERFGPVTSNYHIWQRKIKTAFDPHDLSDSKYYISPEETGE